MSQLRSQDTTHSYLVPPEGDPEVLEVRGADEGLHPTEVADAAAVRPQLLPLPFCRQVRHAQRPSTGREGKVVLLLALGRRRREHLDFVDVRSHLVTESRVRFKFRVSRILSFFNLELPGF